MKLSDRYLKIVEWSEEDECYVGRCPGLMLGGVHGKREKEVYAKLCEAVEDWIHIHQEDGLELPPPTTGKQYSGKFVLRIGEQLHERLSLKAMTEGESLNSFCKKQLEKTV